MTDAEAHAFYTSAAWRRLRGQVLALDNYECMVCKKRGKYSRAEIVHHVRPLKEAPELALSVWDKFHNRQLVSVCKACHEKLHGFNERDGVSAAKERFENSERWD